MKAPKELILQGANYVKISHGLTLERAEEIRINARNDGRLTIVRHYNSKFYVYLCREHETKN